jgi:hypothetical protein
MVSTWPFIATKSDTYDEFGSKGWVFTTEDTDAPIFWDVSERLNCLCLTSDI